jgi:hypothetical protein
MHTVIYYTGQHYHHHWYLVLFNVHKMFQRLWGLEEL